MWGLGFAVGQARTRKLLKTRVAAATPMRRSHYLLSFMLLANGLSVSRGGRGGRVRVAGVRGCECRSMIDLAIVAVAIVAL